MRELPKILHVVEVRKAGLEPGFPDYQTSPFYTIHN